MKKSLFVLVILAVMIGLVACQPSAPAEKPPMEAGDEVEAVVAEPTDTPTAVPTKAPTAAPTITPTPTPTKIPEFSGPKDSYPLVEIISTLAGNQATFEAVAMSETAPELTFSWFQDETNPEPLVLSATAGAQINVSIPQTPGEYFINVTALDGNNNSFTARRLITVTADEVYVNTIDQHAEWINHITLYEINAFDWYHTPDRFVGVTRYLDNLVDLGINTIWFTPVFEGDGLGYWTKDYYKINWMLGAEENFKRMVDLAHDKGIRIVLDFVPNHTWTEHPFYQDVLANKAESPYADWYQWRGAPGESNPVYYYDWITLPNVNVANPEVQEYFTQVAEYWVINFDIDGYRADVAWGVEQDSDTFWLKLVRRLKNIKPEFFMLAEAPAARGRWDFNPSPEHDKSILFDDRFTSVYDWDLRAFEDNQGLIGALSGWRSIAQLNAILTDEYPPRALPLRFVENHDLPRVPGLLDLERSKLGHAVVFTAPGVPLIYGGAEHGQALNQGNECLLPDDPNNTADYFTQLINARKNHIDNDSALVVLPNTNATKVNTYATISDRSIAISAFNFSDQPQEVSIDLTTYQAELAAYARQIDVFETGKLVFADDFNAVVATLAPYEASIVIFTDIEAAAAADSGQPASGSSTAEPVNLLLNGDFAAGFEGWLSYVHESAAAEFTPIDGALQVEIASAGSDLWHVQLLQPLIELVQGETYVLTFTAAAEKPRSINVAFARDGGDFRSYGNQSFTLSTEAQTYEFPFTMLSKTENAPRLAIDLGGAAGDVTFDDFVLQVGE